MKPLPLVSVIILSYKNYHFIYNAIDSVLSQDYSNIELIISNDCSQDFNKKALNKYFSNHKRINIKKIIINNNANNLGTVKNLNTAIKLSHGDYILAFAADDAIFDPSVVSKFINCFNQLPHEELIVTSQVGMYNFNLNRLIQLFVSKDKISKIKNLSPKKLFSEMAIECIIPGCGTCYKKCIFEKYGYFDEKYRLVEDYSSALKFSRLGINYNYFDFISFKHRDGGISHGNVNGGVHVNKQYEKDILNIQKFEVKPYLKLLNSQQRNQFLRDYKIRKWKFSYLYDFQDLTIVQRRFLAKKNISVIFSSFYVDFKNELVDQLIGKKTKILLFGIILYYYSHLNTSLNRLRFLNFSVRFLSYLLIVVSLTFIFYVFFKKFFPRISRILRFVLYEKFL